MKTVLVVDDNPIVRRHMRGLLEFDGCVVCEARDGEEALAWLAARKFDVMFLDLSMPKLDGLGVLLTLSEQKKKIPVVLITSSDSSSEIVNAFKLGVKDYLLKPFREQQVQHALHLTTGLDVNQIHRSPTAIAVLDADEDLAQRIRDASRPIDTVEQCEAPQGVPECASRPHQLVLIGSLEGSPTGTAGADEAEALADVVTQKDTNTALVRLLPPGEQLPDVSVFHAGVTRTDEGRLQQVLRAVRAGGALTLDRKIRALGWSGADYAELYWWTLRHTVERELTRLFASTGSHVVLDLSLAPDHEPYLGGAVEWAVEFSTTRMVDLQIVREPVTPQPPAAVRPVTNPGLTTPPKPGALIGEHSKVGAPMPPPAGPPPTVVGPEVHEKASTRVASPQDVNRLVSVAAAVKETRASEPPVASPPPVADRFSKSDEDVSGFDATSLRPATMPGNRLIGTEPAAPTPMPVVPGFELQERIGEGGMSVVYRAVQKSLRRTVCIKLLRDEIAQDPTIADRFQDEGIALATLRHPNIVSVLDVGRTEDGKLFMVMEYVDGGDLRALLRKQTRLPPARAVELVRQLLGGLAEAHGSNIIHRDLKPSNVLLTHLKDGSPLVKLVDFGIAKLVEGVRRSGQTRVGTLLGTPGYMAPEQFLGMDVTTATDLYAVGIILYELIAGERPFAAKDEFELAQATMMGQVPSLRNTVEAPVPEALDQLIAQLLAKKPGDRPQDASTVRALLTDLRLAQAA